MADFSLVAMKLIRQQPFKAIYILIEISSVLFLRLPYWIISSIPKSNRARRSWSLYRCIFVYGMRRYFLLNGLTGGVLNSPNYRAVRGGKDVHGVWVNPAPELVKGYIQKKFEEALGEFVRLPGYWLTRKGEKFDIKYKPSKSDKIVYTLHGGGFISFSAHPTDPLSTIPQGIVDHCTGLPRVFSLEYRLSTWDLKDHSTHIFPTALVDAIAGYNYLINDMGYAPENVIIEGDSAGANLTLALTRYLIESRLPSLPPPGGLILISPWTDLSLSHVKPGFSSLPAVNADILSPSKYGPGNSWYSIKAYVGVANLSETDSNPYISPASLDIAESNFKNFPRALIIFGDAELLADSTRTLYKRMTEAMGDAVECYEVKDAIHDYLCMKQFQPERTTTLKKIAEWIDEI